MITSRVDSRLNLKFIYGKRRVIFLKNIIFPRLLIAEIFKIFYSNNKAYFLIKK